MPTIGDVAARAQVSTATVSRALNGKPSVDPDLTRRVLEAAAELGYQPHGPARNLRKRETAMIALIVPDIENHAFAALARGAEEVARAQGYSVVLCNAGQHGEHERHYLGVAARERMAGVVIAPNGTTDTDADAPQQMPVVSVDRPVPGCDHVAVDSRAATREATAHLIEPGYRRVACVTGPARFYTTAEQLAGYRDAITSAGRSPDRALVRHAGFDAALGRRATGELLDQPHPPDALVITDNRLTIGALRALAERNLRPGADVGVVGFEDAPWTTLVSPAVSVVDQPDHQVGAAAMTRLLARIADRDLSPASITLPAKLIVRQSSQPS